MKLKGKVAYGKNIKVVLGVAYVDPYCEKLNEMLNGAILVCKRINLDHVELILKSSAVITSYGGMLSHAAIVLRELKHPVIVGVEKADEIIKSGDKIEIDFSKGVIKVISD